MIDWHNPPCDDILMLQSLYLSTDEGVLSVINSSRLIHPHAQTVYLSAEIPKAHIQDSIIFLFLVSYRQIHNAELNLRLSVKTKN